jgi:hypothetical protein
MRTRTRHHGLPLLLVGTAALVVAAGWALFLTFDLWNVGGVRDRAGGLMGHVFNDRPVEWGQWVCLSALAVAGGRLAGRLRTLGAREMGAFWTLVGVAAALMLIEDAGDLRHVIARYVLDFGGEERFSVNRTISDVVYFGAIASVPLYAVARYGRRAWRATAMRPYLAIGVLLYAVAAIGNALRHYDALYIRLGRRLHDALVMNGPMPTPPGMDENRMYFMIIDGPVEESLELLAASALLAACVAYGRQFTTTPAIAAFTEPEWPVAQAASEQVTITWDTPPSPADEPADRAVEQSAEDEAEDEYEPDRGAGR